MLNEDFSVPIVLVHIGKIPKHLQANIDYIIETFESKQLYLIGDVVLQHTVPNSRFHFVHVNELIQEWPKEFSIEDRRKFFRDNFWFTSKARLILIPKFMSKFGIGRVVHVESDVWLHPQFPFGSLEELETPLAFPRVDEKRGIASVMLINGDLGAQLLEDACHTWPSNSDMEILGNLLNYEPKVFELPSFLEVDQFSSLGDWVFDGAALGMYLFGADPRNSYGLVRRFSKSPMSSTLKLGSISLEEGLLTLKNDCLSRRISCLHIHAKNSRVFASNWSEVLSKQLVKEKRNWYYGFNFYAFYFSLKETMRRALFKFFRRQ
jgi:hypothetical protein